MNFWLRQLGLSYDIRFAPFNQVFQQLLDPSSLLGANSAGANFVLVRFEDWGEGTAAHADRLLDAIRHFVGPLLVAVCPPTAGHEAASAAAEATLRRGLADVASAHLIGPSDIAALYPVAEVHDPHANELGKVPYTPEFFTALATALMRKLHAVRSTPYKVIALDCDDTLWSGICGEDGPEGVTLDAPRFALQRFMAAQREAGMLLALCSKNNEEDVDETFAAHPDMPLRPADFVARRINWADKGGNLEELAAELDLGLDSFILVDDNPKECTEVQSSAPQVLALALPPNAGEIPEYLHHVWAFDHARVTEEDRRRSAMYAQQAQRAQLARSSSSLAAFVESLQLQVTIAPAQPEQMRRIAQLTARTNQMNATTVRRSEAELAALTDAEILAVDVTDRFGSYGLTGVVIFRADAAKLRVDTLLLSCRVLGRGVEHRVLAHLGRIALDRGIPRIELPYIPTTRNRPARLFLESVAHRQSETEFAISAEEAASARYNPAAPAVIPARDEAPAAAPAFRVDYRHIATHLRTVEAIHAEVEASRPRAQQPVRVASIAPRTPLERDLAELWGELLRIPPPGVEDNFFDLGGHSLLAVQLLSRARQIYGVELSLEVVYAGPFTVAEMAKAIELKEIEQAAGGDYQDLLRELEGLSDEEVRALLDQEQG